MNQTPESMGERVAHHRKAKLWSQAQLAQRAAISVRSVASIEADERGGRTTLSTATQIAAALGVKLIDILPRDPARRRKP
jgi:transcriptional regulator with XRE-family HTH domain